MAIQRIDEIQRVAKAMDPAVARAFLKTVAAIKDATKLTKIEAAIRRRDVAAVLAAVPMEGLEKQFQANIAKSMRDLAEKAAGIAPMPGGLELAFDVSNPHVFDFIKDAKLNPLLKIRAESEAAIRSMLDKAFREGLPPAAMARQIRDMVGLTANQWETIDRYRQYFDDLTSKGFDTLGKEALYKIGRGGMKASAGVIVRQGLTPERVDKLVANYTDRLIRERAIGIARTLTIDAANAGQNALWNQAVTEGMLQPDEWEVGWIVAHDDRLCERCIAMESMRRPVNGTYPNGVARPTLHPNCRCSEGLIKKTGGLRFMKGSVAQLTAQI